MPEARFGPAGCRVKQNQNTSPKLVSLGGKQIAPMKSRTPVPPPSVDASEEIATADERPWNVRHAAAFLGVSPQTVYLWVERRQIPHLRVMGRNIRFLRSDLARFRDTFRQEPA